MDSTTTPNLNNSLACLLDKYAIEPPELWRLDDGCEPVQDVPPEVLTLLPGWQCIEASVPERVIPLLPWRSERRFRELRNLVDNQTITPVLMCRFACITDGKALPLQAALYRELDLAEWLAGAPIATVYASIDGDRVANAIVRLENGVVCSVEAAATLPVGTPVHDRHELIARRGVASDRVVDTQVAQSSVYVWNDQGAKEFTDTDAELPGLDSESVALVRAAYDVLSRPGDCEELRQRHGRLRHLVSLAFESDRQCRRLHVDGRSS
jgi:hypothetical protein